MLDWESENNEVMINPRFSKEEMEEIMAMLKKSPPIKGHVWMATSGSTAENAGHIKWTALSKAAILASATAVNSILQSTSKDVCDQSPSLLSRRRSRHLGKKLSKQRRNL